MAIYYARQRGTNLVKIGYAKGDPDGRIKTLQTGCPTDIELLASEPGDVSAEKARHREFAPYAFRSEWFRMAAPIAQRVALCNQEFASLAELEPGLLAVAAEIGEVGGGAVTDLAFCANSRWYGYDGPGFKDRVVELVGWGRKGPKGIILGTCEAYDVATDVLYRLLPDCGRCTCGGRE